MTEKERSYQVTLGQWAPVFATAAFSLFVVLGVLAYGIVNTNNRAREVQTKQVRIAACILEQLAEHRIASMQHHKDISLAHNQQYDYPEGVSPPPFNPDTTICEEFFPTEQQVEDAVEEITK